MCSQPKIRSRRFTGVLLSALLAVAACVMAFAISGCNNRDGRAVAATANTPAAPVPVDTVPVVSQRLDMTVNLPGELDPYEEVRVFPKVSGFVKWIGVDRGSVVKKGQLLAVLVAPEIVAQKSEAQAKLLSVENQRIAAQAKLAADQSTYERLKAAAKTPGVISDEELETAEKAAEADRARMVSLQNSVDAARSNVQAAAEMAGYLRITAPFDGVVTKRNVHPGALVGPGGGSGTQPSMLRIEQVAHLRLVVAVPEAYVGGVEKGATVHFTVPAFPNRTFTGTVSRLADALDPTTRTMPVEMDVYNPTGELHSGMYPSVIWPVHRTEATLFVPQSAVGRGADSSYVVLIRNGHADPINVKTGGSVQTNGVSLTEVFGNLQAGDQVALHATEDLRSGAAVSDHPVSSSAS